METNKYTLLECNRLRSNINEDTDEFKNRWTSNINSSGILVKKGDIISLESTSINTIGSTEETMEFSGDANQNGYIDNTTTIGFSFYVNNSGRNLIPLPLRHQRCFKTYGTNPNGEFLLNRGLGEPDFSRPSFIGNDRTDPVNDPQMKPYFGLLTKCEISKFSDSLTGVGFFVNEEYVAKALIYAGNPAVIVTDIDMGFRVKILDVTSEGTNDGIPTRIQVTSLGDYYRSPAFRAPIIGGNYYYGNLNKVRMRLVNPVDTSKPNPATNQDIEVTFAVDAFFSKQNGLPDGKRYYYTDGNYSGIQINHEQFNKFTPQFNKRIQNVTLTAPLGLVTPVTLGENLTNQLNEPTRLNTDFRKSNHLSGNNLSIQISDTNTSVEVTPTIIETPLYKAMSCNSCASRKSTNNYLSGLYAGRRTFFDNVVYSNPDRIKGLQFSRQFYYDRSRVSPLNEIHTGTEDGDEQNAGRGDYHDFQGYTGQIIGDIGLNQCCLIDFDSTNNIVTYQQGNWIVSNVFFTESNVKKVADGFKYAEMYYGLSTDVVNQDQLTPTQKQDLAVAFDLGLYEDETSNGRTSINGSVYTNRRRYSTYLEYNKGVRPQYNSAVAHNNNVCQGTIPFASFNYEEQKQRVQNDGQQLSSVVVTSRWRDEFDYRNRTDNSFTNTYNKVLSQSGDYRFTIDPNVNEGDTYMKNYTDDSFGYKTYDDLIGYSKKYDVGVIPFYPSSGEWELHGGRPFIAYRSHLNLGEGFYDPELNGTTTNFQIDKFNCPYGIQMGYDTSFIRNEACFVYNINYATNNDNNDDLVNLASGLKTYPQFVMSGASNPVIDFDTTSNRFEITGLNTPMTIGNGQIQGSQKSLIPEDNPESQCVELSKIGTIARPFVQPDPTLDYDLFNPPPWATEILQTSFCDTRQSQSSIIDSYTGVSIDNITLTKKDNTTTTISYYGSGLITLGSEVSDDTPIPTWSNTILQDTLLGKMGFSVNQLLPRNGMPSGIFNTTTTQTEYYDIITNTPKPMTTGSFFSSPEYQASVTNANNLPLYSASGSTGLQARPLVSQGGLKALKLPQKLEYPYLNVYSSIVSMGVNTEYFGGGDGKSKLPCLGYVTRFNNSGDFFYQIASNYDFTCLKDFTLTDIDTDIRLPDSSRPRLETHSSVIYKITRREILEEPEIIQKKK